MFWIVSTIARGSGATGLGHRLIDRRSERAAAGRLFQHVNGGWLAKTEIPADKASWGRSTCSFDKSQADLRALVEDAAKSPTRAPGSDAQKIGDFYTASWTKRASSSWA